MQVKHFVRKKEDFICEHCGYSVEGTGYTNHCPKCLWSKHVDVHPGDRAATCGGMMEPTAIETKSDGYRITHTCVVCGHEKPNKSTTEDDFNTILTLSKKYAQ